MSVFLAACGLKETEYTPVWFMRQAGRYLPSYRKIKGSKSVLEIAKNPLLASQAVADAVSQLGVDAGIIFADIMLPLEGMGVEFKIEENVGPVVSNPIRNASDVADPDEFEAETDVGYVFDAIDATLAKLNGTPLIGFSGAPFTLAGYMIEGAPSRELGRTKEMMYRKPEAWSALMRKLTKMVKQYLARQVRHGVNAVQLFDSWVGALSPSDYERYVLPYTKEVFDSVSRSIPKIHFCANSAGLLEVFSTIGADVLSVDWRLRIGEVWERCGDEWGVQGNLDPAAAAAGGGGPPRGGGKVPPGTGGGRGHKFTPGQPRIT